jgi:eukaryotic-like serine/threonine-protein kinase
VTAATALKVLVIDDHADYRRLLSHHIATRWPDAVIREYDPLASGPLPDAFSGAGNDVVLLGHPCNAGDALEWLRRFRQQPRFPAVVFVGDGDERQVVAALRAGADDYVGKPRLRHDRLVTAVDEAIRHRASLATPASPGRATSMPALRGYDILRRLADGEISTVYVARDRTGREVVLKVLRQVPDTGGEKVFDRFLQEYELIARLTHPNVVRIFDLGVADDHAYIAMEHCGGGSLKRRIAAGLDAFEAYHLMRDIAGALGALHEAGILHRDLKPTNVLFRDDQSIALIDFGLAKQVALRAEFTGAGTIFGTPYYVSPEQGHGERVDERGDLYSLGVIFFEMLTGAKPYEGETAMAVIIAHRQAPVPRLPAGLADFQPAIDRLLAKAPADRFQTVAELLAWEPYVAVPAATVTLPGISGRR